MIMNKVNARRPNSFEKLLLVVGILVTALGYFFAHLIVINYGFGSFEAASALLLWFVLIFLLILTAVSENSKEEMKIIINQQHEELKLLRSDLRRKR